MDRDLAIEALGDPVVARLMTIPGIDAVVAMSIVAAVGEFSRFPTAERLVSCLGLNPKVRRSGATPATHGRITKAGRAHARGMLVEAAWSAARDPGPLRAFFTRIKARRGVPDRGRRHRPEDDRPVLASRGQGPGLRVRTARAQRPQAPPPRTHGRRPTGARSTRPGLRPQRPRLPASSTRSVTTPGRPVARRCGTRRFSSWHRSRKTDVEAVAKWFRAEPAAYAAGRADPEFRGEAKSTTSAPSVQSLARQLASHDARPPLTPDVTIASVGSGKFPPSDTSTTSDAMDTTCAHLEKTPLS